MKNQKTVPAHAAESRQTAVRLRKNGWSAALNSGQVPPRYREDINLEAIEENLTQSGTFTSQIRIIERDQSSSGKQKRTDLNQQKKEITAKYKLLEKQA